MKKRLKMILDRKDGGQSREAQTQIQKIIIFYIYMTFSLYFMFLYGGDVMGVSLKVLLLCVCTLITAVLYLLFAFKTGVTIHKPKGLIDWFFVASFLYGIIMIVLHGIKGDHNLEAEILIPVISLSYLLLSNSIDYSRKYLEVLLVSAAVIFMGIWFHDLVARQFIGPIEILLNNSGYLAAYIVLSVTISSIFYCTGVDKVKSLFFIAVCGSGFFFLMIREDSLGLVLTSLMLISIPIVYKTTAELVRRTMHLLCLFCFMLSSMGFIVNYGGFMKEQLSYDILTSVYLDLAIAAVGVAFFSYWDRLPKQVPFTELELPDIKRVFQWILPIGIGIAFIFRQYYMPEDTAFHGVYSRYGTIGILFVISIAIVILRQVHKKCYKRDKDLFILLCVFLGQFLFYGPQSVTTPIFILLLAMALHGKELNSELKWEGGECE